MEFQELKDFITDFNSQYGYDFRVSHQYKHSCWLFGEGFSGQRLSFNNCIESIKKYEKPVEFLNVVYGFLQCPICKKRKNECSHFVKPENLIVVKQGVEKIYMTGKFVYSQPGRNYAPQNSGPGMLVMRYSDLFNFSHSCTVRGNGAILDLVQNNNIKEYSHISFYLMQVIKVDTPHKMWQQMNKQKHRTVKCKWLYIKDMSLENIKTILHDNKQMLECYE